MFPYYAFESICFICNISSKFGIKLGNVQTDLFSYLHDFTFFDII